MIKFMTQPDQNLEQYKTLSIQAGDLNFELELRKAHLQQLYLQMDVCRKKHVDELAYKAKAEQEKVETEKRVDQAGA